ncbi:hypothetical protein ACDI10_16395 [Vreelandella venusta]|uniref:hypothetical protein n=1 Tax=Vreelandella venusta TaxID=44935 RepID=UPI00355860B7
MTGIGEAVAAVRGAYVLARSAKDITDKVKLDTAVSEVLDALGNAQSALLELQQQHFELIDENRNLRQKLSQEERFEKYRMEKTPKGGFVLKLKKEFVSDDEPSHAICHVCKESGKVTVMNESSFSYSCPACQYVARIKDTPPIRAF